MLDWERIRNKDEEYLKNLKTDIQTIENRERRESSNKIDNKYSNNSIDWEGLITNARINEEKMKQNNYIASQRMNETTEDTTKRTFFKRSKAFEDGYQIGDITKTVGSSVGDAGLNVTKGIMRVGEGIGDLAQGGVAQVLDFMGQNEKADTLRNKISINAVDQVFEPITNKIDENSILGDKSDEVAQGIGTTLGFLGSSVVTGGASIPLTIGKFSVSMPLSVIVSSTGSGLEESYSKNAEDWQAWTKAIGSGLIEGFSEGLFDGVFKSIKIGGSSLDKFDDLITGKIKNGLAKTLAKTTLDSTEEGAEEVVSYVLNYGLDHASDLIKNITNLKGNDLAEEFSTEELWENFFTGALSAFISGAPANVITDIKNTKSLGRETTFEVTNWKDNDIVSSEFLKGNYVPINRSKLDRDIAVVQKGNQYVAIDVATGAQMDILKNSKEEAVESIRNKINNLSEEEGDIYYNKLSELDTKTNLYLAETGRLNKIENINNSIYKEINSESIIDSYIKSKPEIFNLSRNSNDYYKSMLRLYSINSNFVKEKAPIAYETFKNLEKNDKNFKNLIKSLSKLGEQKDNILYNQNNNNIVNNENTNTNLAQNNSSNKLKEQTPKKSQNETLDQIDTNDRGIIKRTTMARLQLPRHSSSFVDTNNNVSTSNNISNPIKKVNTSSISKSMQNNENNTKNLKNNEDTIFSSKKLEKENAEKTKNNITEVFKKYVEMQQKESKTYKANIETNLTEQQKFVQDFLKDTYNQEVVYFSENEYSGAEHIFTDNTNLIFVNTDLSRYIENGIDENNLLLFSAFHGFSHNIKQLYPEQYKELIEIVKNSMTEEQKQNYLSTFEGKELEKMLNDNDAIVDEIIADHLGDASTDMTFWQNIKEKAKDLFNAIVERIEKLYKYLTKDYEGINIFANQKQNAEMKEKLEDILIMIQKDITKNQNNKKEGSSNDSRTPLEMEKSNQELPSINNSISQIKKNVKTSENLKKKPTEKIDDFGEYVFGARKDTTLLSSSKKTNKEVIHNYTITSNENNTFDVRFKNKILKEGFKTQKEAEQYIMDFKDNVKSNLATYEKSKISGEYIIKIKNPRTLKNSYINKKFITEEDAKNYALALSMYLKEYGKNLFRPQIQKVTRTNSKSKNATKTTGNDIIEKFGFKGGQFGNWVNNAERQEFLNYAQDAFNDLAEALEIEPKDLGQNGNMSIAFGARGNGLSGAVAHFEPVNKIINMTRLKGAGSLAHEYGHSIDNWLSRLGGYDENGMATESYSYQLKNLPEGIRKSVNEVINSLKYNISKNQDEIDKKNTIYEKNRINSLEYFLSSIDKVFNGESQKYKYDRKSKKYVKTNIEVTLEQKKQYQKIRKILIDGKLKDVRKFIGNSLSSNNFEYDKPLEDLKKLYKEVVGKKINDDIVYGIYNRGKPIEQLTEVKTESAFYKSALELDKATGRVTTYFSRIDEMWARAFEAYISDKLENKNIEDTYLVHSVKNSDYALFNPFPAGEERENIDKAFDNLIQIMKDEGILHNAEKIKNSNRKLEKLDKIQYNKNGIVLDKQEYANVISLINTNRPNQKIGINSISSSNYFYIYQNNGFGNNKIISKIKIEGNEDKIKLLRKELEDGTYETAKAVNSDIQKIKNGRRYNNSNNVSNTRARAGREINRLHSSRNGQGQQIREGQSNNKGIRNKSRIENSNKGSFSIEKNTKNSLRKLSKKETYQKYKDARIKANVAYINNIIKYKNKVVTEIENKIAQKQKELDNKKDKTTKIANNLRLQIERSKNKAKQIELLYNRKIDLLSNELDKENLKKEASDLVKRDLKEIREREIAPLVEDVTTWKDKAIGLLYDRETPERNIYDIVPNKEKANKIIDYLFTPVHENQAEAVKYRSKIADKINSLNLDTEQKYDYARTLEDYEEKLLSSRGINVSKYLEPLKIDEATVAGLYLEKKITDKDIKNYGLNLQRIQNIAKTFNEILDDLFEKANQVLVENGYAPVDKRENYFPHAFQVGPDTAIEKAFSLFGIDITNQDLPTSIAGRTETFKPGKVWNKNLLERNTEITDLDALSILDSYIKGMADVIYNTESIQKVRAFGNSIREFYVNDNIKQSIQEINDRDDLTIDEKKELQDKIYERASIPMPHFVTWLDEYANVLANKKSSGDRDVEKKLNRRIYRIVSDIENKIAKNMIVANVSVALTNFGVMFQAMSSTKVTNILKGAVESMEGYANKLVNGENNDTSYIGNYIRNSTFFVNRHGEREINQRKSKLQKIEKNISEKLNIVDEFATETILRGKYYDNIEAGMTEEEALQKSSEDTAKIMADRSKGALPTIFNEKNPLAKMFTIFQVETNNTLSYVFKDMPREIRNDNEKLKAFSKLAIGDYFFNSMIMTIRGGSEVLFDPIRIGSYLVGALVAGTSGDDDKLKEQLENARDYIVNIVPGLQTLLAFFGVDDVGRIPYNGAFPDMIKIGSIINPFSEDDINYRLKTAGKEMLKPLWYLGLPFGGGQLKKTTEGALSIIKKGNYATNKKGEINNRFEYDNITPLKLLQILIFGQWSTKEAKEYLGDNNLWEILQEYWGNN